MLEKFKEGKVTFYASKGNISRQLDVFYNPDAKLNRDINVAFLKAIKNKNMKIALPLSASGIDGLRILTELDKDKIGCVYFNDIRKKSIEVIRKNLEINNIRERFKIFNLEANKFLLNNKPFDFIEIDPFGSPNPFLDSAIKSLKQGSYLAVTSTDQAALTGTYPFACYKKYWAKPLRNELMHEIAIRILIRKVQLIALQYEIPLIPLISFVNKHYYKVYFKYEKSKKILRKIIKMHKFFLYCNKCLERQVSDVNALTCKCKNFFDYAGPLYVGNLFNVDIIKEMLKQSHTDFLDKLYKEAQLNIIGFFDTHKFAKRYKIGPLNKKRIIEKINSFAKATETIFSPTGIKTNISKDEFLKIIQELI